ncbi:copper amine oxidase N-terminal domain-containing protein [Acetivibrio mesophilus]|uniref:Copper amine oxidase N-terminal domain-containing protein n=1 Tax=Acetivibrio mesophilus TaxID=2487273 RepID=A0A4Q0I0N0_9FIRM|nr:copper amine oxidase N-terminal domain-containing protein [Acetivibrio mesophilus]ODM24560.1 copper amine oxidase [Clostridium sp. Bc-iso-3]ODM24828.1 copper amine oxidase [Clostridium sp. Bc-iso-3]RXE57591.1 copper amine oxidase N-terminal domain-containing protein [Acetivibrio mesophilus]
MKKISLVLAIMCVFMMVTSVEAAIVLPLRVEVDGERLDFPDEQPFIDANGRTQTPARFIAEKLGANVTWNGKEQKAVFEKGSKKLVLYIGKKDYELNGQKKTMDTAALLKEGRTFVPARYVAEAFDAVVSWDPEIRTVYINTKPKPTKKEGTEIVAGFEVPLDTNLAAVEQTWGGITEACFQVNLLRADLEGQWDDLRQILLQKCDSSTVDEVMAYVMQKKEREYYLPDKFIYDKKSGRYIWIKESFMEDVNVFYCSASFDISEE